MTIEPAARPVGVQLYSLRESLADDRPALFARLAEVGFTVVEPYDVRTDPDSLRADLDAAGLVAHSAHVKLASSAGPGEVAAAVDAVLTVGARTLVVPRTEPQSWESADGVASVAEHLAGVVDVAGEAGVNVAYHNHYWEAARWADGRRGLDVFAEMAPAQLSFQVDLYWAYVGGLDVPALLGRLGERVHSVHVKDGPGTVAGDQVVLGHGSTPLAPMLAATRPEALRLLEIDRCAGPVLDMITENRRALARLEAEGSEAGA